MNTVQTLHNLRIPSSAMFDFARSERPVLSATPVFVYGERCYVPILNGDQAPFLLTPDEIESLGGEVPHGGDILVCAEDRKVWLGSTCWVIRHNGERPVFEAC